MHITPKLNSYFQFRAGHVKKKTSNLAFVFQIEIGGKRVDYLLGLPITRTIPGLRLARFPLFSFKASTVVL
jgi:hypothetical protein